MKQLIFNITRLINFGLRHEVTYGLFSDKRSMLKSFIYFETFYQEVRYHGHCCTILVAGSFNIYAFNAKTIKDVGR